MKKDHVNDFASGFVEIGKYIRANEDELRLDDFYSYGPDTNYVLEDDEISCAILEQASDPKSVRIVLTKSGEFLLKE